MTAEIAILNRQSVALAADSAITVGKQRVWKTANKLFSLGPHHDIGVMIYGFGDFIGYPWEVVIKTFRQHFADINVGNLEEASSHFREFLISDRFQSRAQEELGIGALFVRYLDALNLELGHLKAMAFRMELDNRLDTVIGSITPEEKVIEDLTFQEFITLFEDHILKLAADIFPHRITKKLLSKILRAMYETYTRPFSSGYHTGIVLAGFGKNDLMPSLCHLIIDGKFGGKLRCWQEKPFKISNDDPKDHAIVFPSHNLTFSSCLWRV